MMSKGKKTKGKWGYSDTQPTKECPKCHTETYDYDGFGVLYCDVCGYCKHAALTGGVCDFCKKKISTLTCPKHYRILIGKNGCVECEHEQKIDYEELKRIAKRADKMAKDFMADYPTPPAKEEWEKAICFTISVEGLETIYEKNEKRYQITIPVRLAPQFVRTLLSQAHEEGRREERERIIKKIKERKGYVEWATARDNQMHDLVIDGIVNDLQEKEKPECTCVDTTEGHAKHCPAAKYEM